MKIGFDAKRAAQNKTGLGNYSRFILQALANFAPDNEYTLYVPDERKATLLSSLQGKFGQKSPQGSFWKRFRSLWRVWGMTADLANDGIEIYHGLSNELPLNIRKAKGMKTVVTIHDLIFLRYPECYPLVDRLIYNYKFRRACQQADCIIAVSECTKRDIVQLYHIAPEKIKVVYQGCDARFKKTVPAEQRAKVKEKYDLPGQYILYVGSIERRKNLLLLAKALTHLDASYRVIAVGKHTPYADEVTKFLQTHGLTDRMRLIHGVPFGDLPALYQMATVFVYPSFYEGFGIPLLEALHSGVPAIGAHGSCLEEAGGPSSLYVSPTDDQALSKAIKSIYQDPELRERMVCEGRIYARRFEPDKIAESIVGIYKNLRSLDK